MFTSVNVIGLGRVGAAFASRLEERGVAVDTDSPDVVLLCVSDRAIADVAATVPPGPWVAHTSGATPLAALGPRERRFSLHPLQTFTTARGPEQLDGAFAAVTGENPAALDAGFALADLLGLEPFALEDRDRAVYHAGAVVASNYLVTLHRAASDLLAAAGAPAAALEPLMRRTIENGFALTGPLERGDDATVEAHLRAIRARRPQLEAMYTALARATRALALA